MKLTIIHIIYSQAFGHLFQFEVVNTKIIFQSVNWQVNILIRIGYSQLETSVNTFFQRKLGIRWAWRKHFYEKDCHKVPFEKTAHVVLSTGYYKEGGNNSCSNITAQIIVQANILIPLFSFCWTSPLIHYLLVVWTCDFTVYIVNRLL